MSYLYKETLGSFKWYEKEEVTSTNDEIKNLPFAGSPVVLSAVKQVSGRGRRGHSWQEGVGNLYFTYSWQIELKDLSRYVCLIGLSLAETILKLAPSADVTIKWPNDVFLNSQKISGILLENIKDTLWAIGIGVNITASPILAGQGYSAANLKDCGIEIDRCEFLRLYLQKFEQIAAEYAKNGFTPLKARWLTLARNLGQNISIKNENCIKSGLFLTLDDNGYLVLKTNIGEEKIIAGDLFV